eukprot:Gb_22582 [translate_table: standard]
MGEARDTGRRGRERERLAATGTHEVEGAAPHGATRWRGAGRALDGAKRRATRRQKTPRRGRRDSKRNADPWPDWLTQEQRCMSWQGWVAELRKTERGQNERFSQYVA